MVWKAPLVGLAVIAVAGCDKPENLTRADLESVVATNQQATINELADRVKALEEQVTGLQAVEDRQAKLLEAMAKVDLADEKYSDESFRRLFKNDETFRANVNWLLAREGAQPIPKVD